MMAVSSNSYINTPQAQDDSYQFTESWFDTNASVFLDVMSNDRGGAAKQLYSVDNGGALADLLTRDPATCGPWEKTDMGNEIRLNNGRIEYRLLDQSLAEGQTCTDTFVYAIQMGNGTISYATVRVQLTGTNDAPVVTNAAAEQAGTVVEAGSLDDGTAAPGAPGISGSLSASDVDAGATQAWSLVGAQSTTYGTMAIDAASGTWTYSLDNTLAATQALKEGQSVTQSYTARVTDDFGAYADQTVTVTITGTNDAPVVTTAAAEQAGTVVEAGSLDDGTAAPGAPSISGSLSASDVDAGATQAWSLVGAQSTTYGTMAIDAASGTWTYSLDNTLAATQALKEGQSVTQSYTARVTDDFGAYADQTVTVTITGTNDAPTGAATAVLPNGTQGTAYLVSEAVLLLGFSDVDAGTQLHATSLVANHGTVTDNGDGTFTIAPTAGYSGTVQLSYQVTDGLASVSASNSFILDATDTAPVAGSDLIVVSNGTTGVSIPVSALLANDSDPDGNSVSIVGVGGASEGITDLLLNSNGTITFGTTNVTANQSFTYQLSDGTSTTTGTVTVRMVQIANGNTTDTVNLAEQTYSGYVASYIDLKNGTDTATGGGSATDTFVGGPGDDTLKGADGNDSLRGDAGNDSLTGGGGNDTLVGDGGSDTFIFDTALNATTNVDSINGFDDAGSNQDTILLSKAIFSALATSASAAGQALLAADFTSFANGGATADAGSAHIIFDAATGNLYYDANGGTGADRVLFAHLTGISGAVDATDFKVIL